jgi:adenine phosphoribosyltransferase
MGNALASLSVARRVPRRYGTAMDLRHGFDIKRYIRTIPDYPKPGILFRDITTLLANLHAFRAAIDELAWPFLKRDIDYVAGIEARGFILGGAVAHVLGRGFVLIATGGTATAAIDLIRKSGGEVVAAAFVIELPDLGGADRLREKHVKVHTLVQFEGH